MRNGTPIRRRGPKLKVGWFLSLVGSPPQLWNTRERFGISPQEFQRILHERKAYIKEKFLFEVNVRTQCEGDFIAFCITGDAF